jgi:hypothetical protein
MGTFGKLIGFGMGNVGGGGIGMALEKTTNTMVRLSLQPGLDIISGDR